MGFRNLQGCGWDSQKAYDCIIEHQLWRANTFPAVIEDYHPFLNTGALYCIGRSKEGHRPVIVMNMKRYTKENKTEEEWNTRASVFFNWVVENMMVPGHIEAWILMLDVGKLGVTEIPIKLLQKFIRNLTQFFKGRQHYQVVCNTSWAV